MKEIIDASVAPALYYMVLDYVTHREDSYNYMTNKYGTHKVMYLTLEQFNEVVDEAIVFFKEHSIKSF